MRPKMHVVMLLAVAIATVFALANQVSALANSNESGNPDESVMLHVVPDLYDQKADAEDDDYFKVGSAAEECEQLGFPFGFKQDDPTSDGGAGIGDGMSINYTFINGSTVDWDSNLGIDAVILKASTKANVYVYDPEANADDGLRSPSRTTKKGATNYYGISHITFCWDRELLVEKTASGQYDVDHDWSIAKTVQDADIEVGDDAVFDVAVTYEGAEYSNLVVSGDFTISNPWTIDSPATTATDTVTYLGNPYTDDIAVPAILAGSGAVVGYSIDLTGVVGSTEPSGALNEVVINGAGDWGDSAPAGALVDPWSADVVTDDVVDAFDSFDGGPAVLIGTATVPNDASFVVTESNLAAGSYTNTACVLEQTDGTGPQCDSDSVNVTEPGGPGDPPVPEPDGDGHETAFMFGDVCFLEITEDDGGNPISFNRWGWTHEFDGDVILSIYAGAGRCDMSKGELVGEVTITGATGTYDINMFSGYHLDEIQIEYDVIGMVAENGIGDWTVGPGQYDHVDDSPDGATSYSFTTGSPIANGTWLIVHLVVGDF